MARADCAGSARRGGGQGWGAEAHLPPRRRGSGPAALPPGAAGMAAGGRAAPGRAEPALRHPGSPRRPSAPGRPCPLPLRSAAPRPRRRPRGGAPAAGRGWHLAGRSPSLSSLPCLLLPSSLPSPVPPRLGGEVTWLAK